MTSKERHEARYKRRVERRQAKRDKALEGCDTLEQLIDFDNFITAFFKCRKGVGWKHSVQNYRIHLFENIYVTIKLILDKQTVVRGFVEFEINERGKCRHIKSVHISERVVQKLCCLFYLAKAIDRTLIYDNSASTKGKGTHFFLRRLRCHLQRFFRKYGDNKGWIAILDIKSFFDNILHIEIFKKLKGIARDKRIVEVIMQFVDAFNPLFANRTSKRRLTKIEKHKKRLKGKSLGLGSEVSQTFAKSYTNSIDHFMKEVLHLDAFAHYMDDFYIISRSKKLLLKCVDIFRQKLSGIGLTLNENKCRICRLRDTFTLLKVRFNLLESGKILRRVGRKSITRMRRRLKKLAIMLENGEVDFDTVRCSYESWKGHVGAKTSRKKKRRRDPKKGFKMHSRNCIKNMDKLFNELFIKNWHYEQQMP